MMTESNPPAPPSMVPEYRCPRCNSTRAVGRLGTSERVSGTGPGSTFEAVTQAVMICEDCRFREDLVDDQAGHDSFVIAIQRWRNPEFDAAKPYYSSIDFHSETRTRMLRADARDRNYTWPKDPVGDVDRYQRLHAQYQQEGREEGLELPENDALLAQIIANPDDGALRWEYAAWLEQQPRSRRRDDRGGWYESSRDPKLTAWEITAQLQTWDALRADPKADVAKYMYKADEKHQTDIKGLRPGNIGRHHFLGVNFVQFFYVRGFVEHVSIKAPVFLQFAPFLYSLAPLHHLTLTYSKPVMAALAASPHLARIRTIRMPNRVNDNEYTRLNDLVDDDIAVLASSPQLANLTLLDLEDNDQLTIRAFDHLALSPHLRSLSHVALEIYRYGRAFGRFGPHERTFLERRNETWRDELEARHGYLPWLHPEEHYGVPHPLIEPVTAHPVGDASFRPDVAARRRAALPAYIADAIAACVIVDGRIALRDRALAVQLRNAEGDPIGRLVATIVSVRADPALPDLRALVTLTIQQLVVPAGQAPRGAIAAYDHTSGANMPLAPNQTLTVGIPIRSYSLPTP